MRFLFLPLLAQACLALPALAQSTAINYTDIGDGRTGAPLSGSVSAVASTPDGVVYAAGSFSSRADSARSETVMRRSGNRWEPVGPAFTAEHFARINALAIGPRGEVYAGGRFKQVGGDSISAVARWDGARWRALGRGIGRGDMFASVSALAVGPDGALYAGGTFYAAGDTRAENIARWDGSRWTAIGSGVRGDVNALAVSPDGTVYAGGRFGSAGDVPARNVARWDGNLWKPLSAAATDGTNGEVFAVTAGPDGHVVVAGRFTEAGGVPAVRVARWDGTRWAGFGPGLPDPVRAVAVTAGGRLVAGWGDEGSQTITCCLSEWTGTAWRPLSGGANSSVTSLFAEQSGGLLAGGTFTAVGDRAARSVARYSENAGWAAFGSGFDGNVSALVVAPDGRLYAGGSFRTAGSVRAEGLAQWDGREWSPVGGGLRILQYSGAAFSLLIDPEGRLLVGGVFTAAGGVPSRDIARWDGHAWDAIGYPFENAPPYGGGVYEMDTATNGDLYIGGGFGSVNGRVASHVARWDGVRWNGVGEPGGGVYYYVLALAVDTAGTVYTGGTIDGNPPSPAPLVSSWNGASWSPLGSGLTVPDGPVASGSALTFDSEGGLVLGGQFNSISGVPANNVARWNGERWTAMGAGFNDRVDVLYAAADGRLFAGGRFTRALDTGSGRLAVWNGVAWEHVANGVDGTVGALVQDAEGRLIIGGGFLNAGGRPSPFITRLDAYAVSDETTSPATAVSLRAVPNPARGASSLVATHPAGPVTLDVFDALGRRVARVFDGEAATGEQRIPFDAARLAPGVYVVRMTASGTVTSAQVTVVR